MPLNPEDMNIKQLEKQKYDQTIVNMLEKYFPKD